MISVQHVVKRFGAFTALHGIDLELPAGQLTALLGPSGSGKTTLLRIIAGLERADEGQVLFAGQDASRLEPRERGVGFVFQHYALFRHMTVAENVAFGLTVRPRATRPPKAEIRERVQKLLDLVQLSWCGDRFPHQLSGGQRQRIALARALAVEPKVLLLDEPFGALDAQVRKELRRWLRRLHDEVHLTSVFVTHDQEEALEVADRVVVFNQGRVAQVGTPDQVYHHPADAFVHRFLGSVNVFHGRAEGGTAAFGGASVALPEGFSGGGAAAFVRPHEVLVARAADANAAIPARVEQVSAAGPFVRIDLVRSDGSARIEAALPHERQAELALKPGDEVFLGFQRAAVYPVAAGGDYVI